MDLPQCAMATRASSAKRRVMGLFKTQVIPPLSGFACAFASGLNPGQGRRVSARPRNRRIRSRLLVNHSVGQALDSDQRCHP